MPEVLEISQNESLAVHAMVLLASETGRVHTAEGIASRLAVPQDRLSKVLQRLDDLGYVAPSGRDSGFTITPSGESATVFDVIDSIGGSLRSANCLFPFPPSARADCCALAELLATVNEQVRGTLASVRFADLKDSRRGR